MDPSPIVYSSSDSEIDIPYVDEDNGISDIEAELDLKIGKYAIVKYQGNQYPCKESLPIPIVKAANINSTYIHIEIGTVTI